MKRKVNYIKLIIVIVVVEKELMMMFTLQFIKMENALDLEKELIIPLKGILFILKLTKTQTLMKFDSQLWIIQIIGNVFI